MVTQAQDNRPCCQAAPQPQDDHVKKIVILGGGTGGTLTANRLRFLPKARFPWQFIRISCENNDAAGRGAGVIA